MRGAFYDALREFDAVMQIEPTASGRRTLTRTNRWPKSIRACSRSRLINARPARIASLRKMAKAAGLDPNRWFNNVELIASREIGGEAFQIR